MILPDPRDVLVFRSAQPGRSFETWLFQKLTPGARRAVAAAVAGCGPHWRPDRGAVGIARRHGPALYEAQVCVRGPARRRPGAVRSVRGALETVGVFFLWAGSGPVILSAGEWSDDGQGLPRNLGLGDARHRLRELRALEEAGYLERRLVLYTFDEIRHQSRVGRLIAWDREKRAGLTAFADVYRLVAEEAAAEGPRALRELGAEEDRRRLGFVLETLRAKAGATQQDIAAAAGVRQPLVSEVESGVANATQSTLSAIAHALGARLDLAPGLTPGRPAPLPARSRAPRR